MDQAAFRSVTDRGVDALDVVVGNVLSEQASQVVLAQDPKLEIDRATSGEKMESLSKIR